MLIGLHNPYDRNMVFITRHSTLLDVRVFFLVSRVGDKCVRAFRLVSGGYVKTKHIELLSELRG